MFLSIVSLWWKHYILLWYSAFLPICRFSDVLLVAWNSHSRRIYTTQTAPLQIRAPPAPKRHLSNIHQHTLSRPVRTREQEWGQLQTKNINNILYTGKTSEWEVINWKEEIQPKPEPTGREAWEKQSSLHRTLERNRNHFPWCRARVQVCWKQMDQKLMQRARRRPTPVQPGLPLPSPGRKGWIRDPQNSRHNWEPARDPLWNGIKWPSALWTVTPHTLLPALGSQNAGSEAYTPQAEDQMTHLQESWRVQEKRLSETDLAGSPSEPPRSQQNHQHGAHWPIGLAQAHITFVWAGDHQTLEGSC